MAWRVQRLGMQEGGMLAAGDDCPSLAQYLVLHTKENPHRTANDLQRLEQE